MFNNLELVRDRFIHYQPEPDSKFRTDSGFSSEEEKLFQKVRQYWADDSIPNEVKLRGFEMDLSNFDPRNTSFLELKNIRLGLQALGIIDSMTGSFLDSAYLDFDAQGNQINKDKRVNVFEYFDHSLKFLKGYIADGHGFAEDTLTQLNTGITVMKALEQRAELMRSPSWIDVKV